MRPLNVAGLWLMVLLLFSPQAFGVNKLKQYKEAQDRAKNAVDIFSGGPVEIRARVVLHAKTDTVEGTYDSIRFSTERFRIDLQLPQFRESFVRNGDARYRAQSRDLEPLPVSYLGELIGTASAIGSEVEISEITHVVVAGRKATCYGFRVGAMWDSGLGDGDQHCFDDVTGVLVSREMHFTGEVRRFEYSDFAGYAGKVYPRSMRASLGNQPIAEIRVQSIAPPRQTAAEILQPPADSSQLPLCRKFQPATADYGPEFDRLRSEPKQHGKVILAGKVDTQGKTSGVEVQQSYDPQATELAFKALKEMRIEPARCDGARVPSYFRLEMTFTKIAHYDPFYSFQ